MIRKTLRAVLLAWPLGLVALPLAPASALTASCQREMDQFSQAREGAVKRINSFNKRRPSASQACAAFGDLNNAETRMLKWMNDNQTWCQIPEQFIEQFKQATERTQKVRGQVCTAAKREREGAVRQSGAPRGPSAGAGVRLPQGAL